jgi:hypothetical protein
MKEPCGVGLVPWWFSPAPWPHAACQGCAGVVRVIRCHPQQVDEYLQLFVQRCCSGCDREQNDQGSQRSGSTLSLGPRSK